MTLFLAMLLDAAMGEPKWLWSRVPHPAVLMGRLIALADQHLNTGSFRLLRGVATMTALALAALALGALLSCLGPVAEILIAAILLAQKSLVQHVQAVADALRLSVGDGRRAVAMIVGRDTAQMDAPAVSRAAIESAAENLSDGVIAPAFWFLIGGLPGLLLYKITNTADSMIGHRTPRHEQFGWAAARFDDLLNLIPARLTALLIAATHHVLTDWPAIRTEARQHRSPNAGWPEAAMARALNVALSGPRAYHGQMRAYPWVHPSGSRTPGPLQIDAAVAALWRAWGLTLGAAFAIGAAQLLACWVF
ncbi:cobalamin biosynthesis protein [Thalassobius vesicularis]|uniref:Cobalamin biosynthesis protein CobD n=1 Tax=Thalassobius vesicularis TaxID=1294297 RepID=A0A4V3UYP9_9RHOB|nr:adenosylcobinamide-phosphate synthase CbiB [Thalassobius vesicularis]THD72019.1 cobalamin biosynthesis protein [Thalassobius vesicularis]